MVNAPVHRWEHPGAGFPIRDAEFLDATTHLTMPRRLRGQGLRPDAFDRPRVAIVGARAASPAGLADARELAAFCARAGLTVVSGLALGIDAAAHEGAIDAGGLTVGVIASGLDIEYPREHTRLYARVREQGLVVTEHPDGTAPLPRRFPERNRIIAALADVVVLVEASEKGGALHTARDALTCNRDVYAMPGSRRNPLAAGCNRLIADGATMLLEPPDLLFGLGLGGTLDATWSAPPEPPRDPDQRAVWRAFAGEGANIETLRTRCTLPAERLGAALRELERSRRVVRRRGMWWPA